MWVGGQPDVFSEKKFDGRVRVVSFFFAACYLVITLRLFYLQVIRGENLSQMSESNRTQLIFFRAPRGDVYDRKGRLLVTNRPSWSLMYSLPEKSIVDRERIKSLLEPYLEQFPKHWTSRLDRAFRSGHMVRLAEDVPNNISFGLQEMGELLPGLRVVMEFRRGYPSESLSGHVLGYLGEISDKEMRDEQWGQRKSGDLIGKTGIERVFDPQIRGTDGGMLIEVDSVGRLKRVIKELPSQKGASIQLTIDLDMQRAAKEGLAQTLTGRGAAVAIDVNTGAVLAWVSSPSFEPGRSLAEDVVDPDLPFYDRAYKGAYPPGSVFKMMTAIAGFETNNVRLSEKVNCIGYLTLPDKKLGEKKYGCWKKHGVVDYWSAMAQSCNCYFYGLGQRVGADAINRVAQQFGFGDPAQNFFVGEVAGTLPSPSWKRRRGWGGWSTGDTYNMSIGQGFVTATPLQLAMMTVGLATRGTIWEPYIVEKIIEADGTVTSPTTKTLRRTIQLKENTWNMVLQAMRGVVMNGTGGATNIPYLDVRGKSGTAQNPHGEPHGWFVAFAGYPGEPPAVAVCVFVENGGHGGVVAAPIVRKMLEIALPEKKGTNV